MRQRCLRQLPRDLTAARAHRLVLEGRDDRDALDARTLRATLGAQPSLGGVVYEHLDSTQEPLLWIPDALGWCYGAGGDWRRRVACAINAVIDCDQL